MFTLLERFRAVLFDQLVLRTHHLFKMYYILIISQGICFVFNNYTLIIFCPWSRSTAAAMPERVHSFQAQNFHALRRACLRRGSLFKDPLFPASAQSLFYRREPPLGLTWKRPRVSHGHPPSPPPPRTHQIGLIKALSIMGQGVSENWAFGQPVSTV